MRAKKLGMLARTVSKMARKVRMPRASSADTEGSIDIEATLRRRMAKGVRNEETS